jgi:type I restriction enzyme S subunit
MQSDWQETSIGSVCSRVFSGGTPTSTNLSYYGGGIPWLRTKEVNYSKVYSTEETISDAGLAASSAKMVPVNAVIVAMYGNGDTAGRAAIAKVPLTTNQACCNLVVDATRADYRFVYYYLRSQYQALVDLKNGGRSKTSTGNSSRRSRYGYPIYRSRMKLQMS